MKEFNSIEEMIPYYDKEKNLFYIEDDIKLNFNLNCACDITAWNINARDITAGNINASDITACNINARNIDAWEIYSLDINARNINAGNITAKSIKAKDILYYAVCFAYKNILCDSIKGRIENARHFVLDGKLIYKGEQKK